MKYRWSVKVLLSGVGSTMDLPAKKPTKETWIHAIFKVPIMYIY